MRVGIFEWCWHGYVYGSNYPVIAGNNVDMSESCVGFHTVAMDAVTL